MVLLFTSDWRTETCKKVKIKKKTPNTYNIVWHGNKILLTKARAFELLIREALPSPLVFRGSLGRLYA